MNYLVSSLCMIGLLLAKVTGFSLSKCNRDDENLNTIAYTKYGNYKGTCDHVNVNDKSKMFSSNVYSWLGIAYAKPPIGERRFRAPEPLEPLWERQNANEIVDATRVPSICLQAIPNDLEFQFNGFSMYEPSRSARLEASEDCLYLNVWSPDKAFLKMNLNNLNYKAPIMVFFHGGLGSDASKGSSLLDIYNPSTFVAMTGVIVVTVNYRLGLFGFMHLNESGADEYLAGNQALLDQHMALKWINENAASFGGDSKKVTIVGQGYGGVLASFHLLYRPGWHLFQNMILQSASPFMQSMAPLTSQEATERTIEFLTTYANCTDASSYVKCARQFNSYELAKAVQSYFGKRLLNGNVQAAAWLGTAFKPVIDGNFLKKNLAELFDEHEFKDCRILMGFTSNEGSMNLARSKMIGPQSPLSVVTEHNINEMPSSLDFAGFDRFLSKYFQVYLNWPKTKDINIKQEILRDYANDMSQTNYLHTLEKIIGDESAVCPVLKLASVYANRKNRVYVYEYQHRISSSPWPKRYGVVSGDELAMTFAQPFSEASSFSPNVSSINPWSPQHYAVYDENEKSLCKEIITYWSNFAKYNSPNSYSSYRQPNSSRFWPPFQRTKSVNRLIDDAGAFEQDSEVKHFYLKLKTNGSQMDTISRTNECRLWNNRIPSMLKSLNQLNSIIDQVHRKTANKNLNKAKISSMKTVQIESYSNGIDSYEENSLI